jgi:hypothetical protein
MAQARRSRATRRPPPFDDERLMWPPAQTRSYRPPSARDSEHWLCRWFVLLLCLFGYSIQMGLWNGGRAPLPTSLSALSAGP